MREVVEVPLSLDRRMIEHIEVPSAHPLTYHHQLVLECGQIGQHLVYMLVPCQDLSILRIGGHIQISVGMLLVERLEEGGTDGHIPYALLDDEESSLATRVIEHRGEVLRGLILGVLLFGNRYEIVQYLLSKGGFLWGYHG